jgi:hypothetical protein
MKTLMSMVVLSTLAGTPVLANTTTATTAVQAAATTTAKVQTVQPHLLDNVTASMSAAFTGPSVASITGNSKNQISHTVDANGADSGRVYSDTNVRVGYNITKDINVSGNAPFNYFPAGTQDLQWLDPYVRIAHSKLITGPVNLSGDVRFYLPTSTASVASHRLIGIRNSLSASYVVPSTRWTLGTDTILRARFYGEDTGGAQSFLAYISPNASFQVTPTLAASVFAEFAAISRASKGITAFESDGTFLGPGLSWDVTPAINFNPYLYFQSFHINAESTVVAFNLSARFL